MESDFLLVSTLDDIAWLTNLRGTDIDFNPLFFSYLLLNVQENEIILFSDVNYGLKREEDKPE